MTHDELVNRGERWLRNTKHCGVVLAETTSIVCEIPDVIGWQGGVSHLIECKVSRSDFQADQKKLFRHCPKYGMGMYRWYMTPPGLVTIAELPEHWGLLEVYETIVRVVHDSQAMIDYSLLNENRLLLSELRLFQIVMEGGTLTPSKRANRIMEAFSRGNTDGAQDQLPEGCG